MRCHRLDPGAPNLVTGRRLHAEGKGGSGSRHSRDYCKGLPLEYTGRQLELVRGDQFSVSEGSEALGAARRAREEEKLRSLLSKGPAAKGGDGNYGGKSRKGKSAGKGKPDEGGKNRAGEGRGRDDGKNAGKK